MKTEGEIYSFLESLGDSSEEVRQSLLQLGIKGDHHAHSCPIANALAQELNEGKYGVTGYLVTHSGKTKFLKKFRHLDIVAPKAIKDFVGNFDIGLYPELKK